MPNVRRIDPNPKPRLTQQKLRVAAYCRVSTDNSDQLESLDAQKSHYTSLIMQHRDWEFAGLFYDSGITGTKADIRDGLQDMLRACRMGKIDLIVVKSISRLSRNTTDCLTIVRELLGLHVKIYFEKENINTGDMESEIFLSILSSMAEEESVSISQNEKWSIRKRMEAGTFKIHYPPYGYTLNGGKLVIEPDEAEVVRFIFASILAGYSTVKVAEALEMQHIPTRKGGKWSAATIRDIAANEKYVGDALFQKTYTDDHFRRHQNNDHLPTHLISDHHEPIVSREDFEKANAIIRQHAKEKGMTPGTRSSINRYAFSGKIVCDHCGAKFIRRIQNNGNEIAWSCQTHLTDIHSCPIKYILDDAIKTALVTMFNKLIFSRKLLLKPLLERIRNTSSDENVRRMQELQQLLEGITGKKNTLRQLRAQGIIDTVMYNQELNRLNKTADDFKAELQALGQYTSSDAAEIKALKSLIRFTENCPYLDEYSDTLFTDFVDHIVVYDRNNIGFKLKCGLLLREVI